MTDKTSKTRKSQKAPKKRYLTQEDFDPEFLKRMLDASHEDAGPVMTSEEFREWLHNIAREVREEVAREAEAKKNKG